MSESEHLRKRSPLMETGYSKISLSVRGSGFGVWVGLPFALALMNHQSRHLHLSGVQTFNGL